ncbi:hypothetical protein PXH69_24700 [Rhodococcus qingshengii]|uniref:Uncharacterized protein n=1 Tax=Rhodococcus qingshengii TaxID=334542 RepID=A0AAW6LSF1_RHOSG|nr:hypothetical protein [Rhodococcus qingshengii]MDE8648172.1 hypothetical protein [Rhodococcus qingshengii]
MPDAKDLERLKRDLLRKPLGGMVHVYVPERAHQFGLVPDPTTGELTFEEVLEPLYSDTMSAFDHAHRQFKAMASELKELGVGPEPDEEYEEVYQWGVLEPIHRTKVPAETPADRAMRAFKERQAIREATLREVREREAQEKEAAGRRRAEEARKRFLSEQKALSKARSDWAKREPPQKPVAPPEPEPEPLEWELVATCPECNWIDLHNLRAIPDVYDKVIRVCRSCDHEWRQQ